MMFLVRHLQDCYILVKLSGQHQPEVAPKFPHFSLLIGISSPALLQANFKIPWRDFVFVMAALKYSMTAIRLLYMLTKHHSSSLSQSKKEQNEENLANISGEEYKIRACKTFL